MSYTHSGVYVIQIVDTDADGDATTWYAGPYGRLHAQAAAVQLETATAEHTIARTCTIAALHSDTAALLASDGGPPEPAHDPGSSQDRIRDTQARVERLLEDLELRGHRAQRDDARYDIEPETSLPTRGMGIDR